MLQSEESLPPYADVCLRMPPYADVCFNQKRVCLHVLTYADVCLRMPPYADVCFNQKRVCLRMPPYADVCLRMLTYASIRRESASKHPDKCTKMEASSYKTACSLRGVQLQELSVLISICALSEALSLRASDPCWLLTYADVCWCMLTYADVC
jgi:hypothetical protein